MARQPVELDRREAVATLLDGRGNLLVIAGLGSPAYDVHHAGDSDANYYLWGAMGGAAMVGLGLAQARRDHRVLVITGDGEQLMGLGGLATIAVAQPRNLAIVVLDNGHYGETGMQRSHTGLGIDLASIAGAAGFAGAVTVTDQAGLESAAQSIRERASGPRLYVVKVKPENLPRSLPPRDGVHLKNRLRTHLGFVVA